jgi:RecB family exonuclease
VSRRRQERRLVRARSLGRFRDALVGLALDGAPAEIRRRLIIVPTRASAELLRQSLEARRLRAHGDAVVLPDLVTRDEWLERLHPASGPRRWIGRLERELLMHRGARHARRRLRDAPAPFSLRPALVSAMLDFYDALRRRQRTVRRFARSLFDELRVERDTDRGSDSLITQTTFLAFAYLAYQRGLDAAGAMDEHTLRDGLLTTQPPLPFDHVVVAVADHPADQRGLWPSDFDLLSRLDAVRRLDVVVTDETHDAGFRDRVEHELPGIVEAAAVPTAEEGSPAIVRPTAEGSEAPPVFLSRDREEELRDVVRAIRARAEDGRVQSRTAVVFHRPLPYLYLAPRVFAAGGVPCDVWDALPLAIESYAALFDMLMEVAATGGTRAAMVPLLRCPLVRVTVDGDAVDETDVTALDAALAAQRVVGEADSFVAAVDDNTAGSTHNPRATRAARAAADLRRQLLPFRHADHAADQIDVLTQTLRAIEVRASTGDEWYERESHARAHVLGVLQEAADACRRAAEPARDPAELAAFLRHAIESRTFAAPRPAARRAGSAGVPLVDAMAARFADVDHVHLIGLVDTEWADAGSGNIFYTTGLLKSLGWPQEADRRRAGHAAFRDLLRLGAQSTTLHAFQFDGDAVVGLSPLIDAARSLAAITMPPPAPPVFRFPEALLSDDSIDPAAVLATSPAQHWVDLRRNRPAPAAPAYAGYAGPQPSRAYRVSRVERYVECPFKYFAESVLELTEEREQAAGLTPLERGSLVHELFQRFYAGWHAAGRRNITATDLPEALDRFAQLTDEALARLPAADRVLERTRLLGSIVATGLAERVFQIEADADDVVVDRLVEVPVGGVFSFPGPDADRDVAIEIRGKADRIDVLDGRRLRVVDYKLGRLPDVDTALQIGVYAHCAVQLLERRHHRRYDVASAMYVAFGDEREVAAPLGSATVPAAAVVHSKAVAFADAIGRIERGEYPVRPLRTSECVWCGFAGVCRKDYATSNDDEPADAL